MKESSSTSPKPKKSKKSKKGKGSKSLPLAGKWVLITNYARMARGVEKARSVKPRAIEVEFFTDIYDEFKKQILSIHGNGISMGAVTTLFLKAMEVVEAIRVNGAELTGDQKASMADDLVEYMIKDLADSGVFKPGVEKALLDLLESPVGTKVIYTATSLASKLKVQINRLAKFVDEKACGGKCLGGKPCL